ncbi:cyclic nucleotide-binding domain-containing protein [Isosphaeraceae bacterium EP7]
MLSTAAAEQFLAVPLLAEVSRESRQALVDALEEGHAKAGATLIGQDKPNEQLSFLIGGTVAVTHDFPDSRRETVTTLSAPAVFGMPSFFLASPSLVSIRAVTNVHILTLSHPAHEALRRDHPRAAEALSIAVVRELADRFDVLVKRVSDHMAEHKGDAPRASEWSSFRAQLFEDGGT